MMSTDSSLTDIIAAQPAGIDSDALLQASRRLDWRFLLPDPALGRVAYVGPARGTLVESLRLFSDSLALIATDSSDARYDLVVASDPTLAALRRAVGLVRPGGWLYVEAHGPLWLGWLRRGAHLRPGSGPRLRYAADYVAAIARLGLSEVEAHWHWPDFESCAEIVPLADRDALELAFARRHGRAARLKAATGRLLVRGGLLARLVPCFSIVARRET